MKHFFIEGSMGPREVVELLPVSKLFLEIDVNLVGEELVDPKPIGPEAVCGVRRGGSTFIRLCRSLLVRNEGTRFASTTTSEPVRGLRPMRPSRTLVVNAPKPRSSTRPPSFSALVISFRTVFTTRSSTTLAVLICRG